MFLNVYIQIVSSILLLYCSVSRVCNDITSFIPDIYNLYFLSPSLPPSLSSSLSLFISLVRGLSILVIFQSTNFYFYLFFYFWFLISLISTICIIYLLLLNLCSSCSSFSNFLKWKPKLLMENILLN